MINEEFEFLLEVSDEDVADLKPINSGKPWNYEQDTRLIKLLKESVIISVPSSRLNDAFEIIADKMGRSVDGVKARMTRLKIIDKRNSKNINTEILNKPIDEILENKRVRKRNSAGFERNKFINLVELILKDRSVYNFEEDLHVEVKYLCKKYNMTKDEVKHKIILEFL